MRVQYEATLDDMVDVSLRAMSRSRLARSWRWQSALGTGLVAGLILFELVHESPGVSLAVGGIAAVVGEALYAIRQVRAVRLVRLKYCQEQYGADGTVKFELQLSEAGLWSRQNKTHTIFDWPAISAIEQTPDAIDFLTREGGVVSVHRRGFQSDEEMRQL